MTSRMLKRLCGAACVALVAFGSMSFDQAGASTASAAAPQAPVQRTCDDYIPRDLALSVPNAAPGQTITITGLAYPGDTVTIRISTLGGPPIVLGTAVANAGGFFSAQITIPANFVEGTYNITVSSPNCEGVTTITIVVRYPQGRCTARKVIQTRRGDTVVWELFGVLDTTKPLTVTLVPIQGGPSTVVYTGPYPASGDVTFVVPSSLANGRYRIVESGTGLNGKPLSARCGRLVVRGGGGGGGTTTTTTSTTSTSIPGGSSTTSTTSTTIPGGTCETSSQAFSFDGTRLIDYDGYNAKVAYTGVIPVSLGAGSWNISQAVSRDTYPARAGVTQLSEVWEIEFLDAGGNVLAHSAPTGDVPDMVVYGEWVGPLGAVALPAGVVGVRAHHLPDLYADGPDGPANSVVPISFVICQGGGGSGSTTTTSPTTTTSTTVPGSTSTTSTTVPGSTSTTTTLPGSTTTSTIPGSTSTTSTTVPGSTSTTTSTSTTSSTTVPGGGGGGSTTTTSTTVPGATTTSTTVPGSGNVVPTSVAGAVENQQVTQIGSNTPTQVAGNSTTRSGGSGGSGLATTGSTVRPLISLAVGLIAVGALIALGARRRRD